MPRPTHFEIQADDPQRAINFYTNLFGWKFDVYVDGVYWFITTGDEGTPGIDGGLGPREASAPAKGAGANGYVCIVDVEDIDATIAAVVQAGGEVTAAKHAIPGVGWLAYFLDTENNTFGAMQNDTNAA